MLRRALWSWLSMQMEEGGGDSFLFCFPLVSFPVLNHSCALNTHPKHTLTMAHYFGVFGVCISGFLGQWSGMGLGVKQFSASLRSVERETAYAGHVQGTAGQLKCGFECLCLDKGWCLL